jgi:hypothetical protein
VEVEGAEVEADEVVVVAGVADETGFKLQLISI